MMKISTLALSLMATATTSAEERQLRSTIPKVMLGVAEEFAILSATGITDVYPSAVVGDVGTSPITGAALLLKCDEVVGNVYVVDAAGPVGCSTTDSSKLTTAIGDMTFAYNLAAGVNNPDFFNLEAGAIGGKTLAPGVYKWASPVLIAADIYLEGTGSTYDQWIFQIDGTLDLSTGVKIHLLNGALVKNIVWVVGQQVTMQAGAHSEGVVLGKEGISMVTGATHSGRLLAQTAVTLQMNTVVQPQA
jgi:hypothetical protein